MLFDGRSIRWVARLQNVREVTLQGTAQAEFWTDYLKRESLAPRLHNGRAQVLIVGANSRFKGVKFREISFSVAVHQGATQHAAYLVQAFNTQRFFAFCERVLFKTPYHHAMCQVSSAPLCGLDVCRNGHELFRAVMTESREPSFAGDDRWFGPIYLPSTAHTAGGKRMFYGNLEGRTVRFPVHASDRISMSPSNEFPVGKLLLDSEFIAEEWVVRENAKHAKSKTYRMDLHQGAPDIDPSSNLF